MIAKAEGIEGGMERNVGVSRCKLLCRMNKKQGPTIYHRELYSASYDKS